MSYREYYHMGDYSEVYEFSVLLRGIQSVYKDPINFVD
jgi:23S rRNA A2030 N6-methylase RlmJ